MFKTTEEAREYFNKYFSYKDITLSQFNRLIRIVEEHLDKWNDSLPEEHDNRYHMTIYRHLTKGTRYVLMNNIIEYGYIMVKCDTYSIREGISFHKDGFIGFAGWSDSDNVKPFLAAFEVWCKTLSSNCGFPSNPDIGQIFVQNDVQYIYTGQDWSYMDTIVNKLNRVLQIVENSDECSLKSQIIEIIGEGRCR